MITFDAAFKAGCNKSYVKDLGYIIDLKYNSGITIRFSTQNVHLTTLSNQTVHACVKSVSDIISSINPHDCSYSVSNFTFTLAEGFLYTVLGFRYNTVDVVNADVNNFRNREVNVRLCHGNASGYTAGTDYPLIFSGVTKEFHWDELEQVWVFECVASGELKHKDLPSTFVNKTDHPNAPDSALGAPIPLLYGSFIQEDTSPYYDRYNLHYHMAPSVCTSLTKGQYVFASHEINAIDEERIAIFLDDLDTYGLDITDKSNTFPTVSTTTASANLPNEDHIKIQNLPLVPKLKGFTNDVSDVENIVDGDYNTYATIAASEDLALRFQGINSDLLFKSVFASGDIYLITFFYSYTGTVNNAQFRFYNSLGATPEYLTPNNANRFTGAGTLHEFYLSTSTGGVYTEIGNATRTDQNAVAKTDTDEFTWDEIGRGEWGIKIGAGTSVEARFFCLNIKGLILSSSTPTFLQAPKRGTYFYYPNGWRNGLSFSRILLYDLTKDIIPQKGTAGISKEIAVSSIFCNHIIGREFGSWIDDVGRANTFSAGNAITRSAFIVESILRDELGFANADINEASFDAPTESDLATYDFSLNQTIGSKDLIRDLSFYDNAITFQTSDGQWYFYKFPTTPSSSTLDLYEDQIKIKKVYWTPTEWTCNYAKTNYHFDYAKGTFLKERISEDATSQADTFDGQNRTATAELNCPYYRHVTNGLNFVNSFTDNFVAQWKDAHLLVDFDLLDVSLWGLQEGDVVTFNNFGSQRDLNQTLIPYNPMGIGKGSATDSWSSFTAPRTKYFLIIACSRSLERGVTSYTAFQLHDLS